MGMSFHFWGEVGRYPGVELLGCAVIICLWFLEDAEVFSKAVSTFHFNVFFIAKGGDIMFHHSVIHSPCIGFPHVMDNCLINKEYINEIITSFKILSSVGEPGKQPGHNTLRGLWRKPTPSSEDKHEGTCPRLVGTGPTHYDSWKVTQEGQVVEFSIIRDKQAFVPAHTPQFHCGAQPHTIIQPQ